MVQTPQYKQVKMTQTVGSLQQGTTANLPVEKADQLIAAGQAQEYTQDQAQQDLQNQQKSVQGGTENKALTGADATKSGTGTTATGNTQTAGQTVNTTGTTGTTSKTDPNKAA